MYQVRSQWLTSSGAAVVPAPALARALTADAQAFGRKKRRWRDIDLTVDLGRDLLSKDWWRGLGTLSALCLVAALLAPGFAPLPGGRAESLGDAEYDQMQAVGITALANGARTGRRMAETSLVEPLSSAPERPRIELFAKLGQNDSLSRLLGRSGATHAHAARAAATSSL